MKLIKILSVTVFFFKNITDKDLIGVIEIWSVVLIEKLKIFSKMIKVFKNYD